MKTSKWLVVGIAAMVALGGLTLARARTQDEGLGRFAQGRFLQRAKAKLGLSDEQMTQIKGTLSADKDKLTSLLAGVHDARVSLREAIQKPGASEDDIRATAAKVGAAEADLAVERAKLYGKISPILTADQLAKVAEFQQRMDDFVDGAIAVFGKHLAE